MKITIIGTGYVGLVSGACLADTGNEVVCVDKNPKKIALLQDGIVPFYEPGLEALVKRGLKEGRLKFTQNISQGLDKTQIIFLTVDTPPSPSGAADLTNIFEVARQVGENLTGPALVVTKSTVPVGTTLKVKEIIQKKLAERNLSQDGVAVASNPEFLKEGSAIQDCRYPDRIVVGVESDAQAEILKELFEPFMRKKHCFLVMDITSAELSKYAANAMLATRISFMNEMANLCEKVGANIDLVRQAIGWDPRIGSHFLYAGLGYGGSCLPKDVQALIELAKQRDLPLRIVEAVDETNRRQKEKFVQKICTHFGGEQHLRGKQFALWGLAFKPETDDIRSAPALALIEKLTSLGARLNVFDPVAMENVRAQIGEKIVYCQGNYDCLVDADALIIATEWSEFRSPDFSKMKSSMKQPIIFDGRNLYQPQKMKELGFDYISMGR